MEGPSYKEWDQFLWGELTPLDTIEGPILINFCFMALEIFLPLLEESLTVLFVQLRKF